MKSIIKILLIITIIALSSCVATKKSTKPTWIKDDVKVTDNYLTAIGRSEDFGSKSWQMAELDAHKKMAKVIDIYIEGYRQSYKKFVENIEGDKDGFTRIIDKTHITSKAILGNLEIVKDENKHELRWFDEISKQYYIKIRLNLSVADKQISKEIIKELPAKTQEQAIKELTTRSKDAHKRLSDKLKDIKWE